MSELSICTTQNVVINFTTATIGQRIASFFIDLGIIIAYLIIVIWGVFYSLGFSRLLEVMDTWSRVALILLFCLPVIIYTVTLESLLDGQTIGKKLMKIKVVKIDGYQAGFSDYLIRWFFRLVDILIFNGIIAVVTIGSSKNSQRFGDMAAGTSVITLKSNINISHTILEELEDHYIPQYPSVIKLSDNDMRIIKDHFQQAVAKDDYATMAKLTEKIEFVIGVKNELNGNKVFLDTIVKDYNFYTRNM